MMLPALDSPPRGISVLQSTSIPAPTGGWNARDNIANMKPDDALILDNFFPEMDRVTLRNGFTMHSQRGVSNSSPVQSLMAYNSATTSKLFSVNDDGIWDSTLFAQISSPDYSSHTESRFQHVNFGTIGGQFLIAVNGTDDPLNYNGSAWATTPAISGSGLTASDLIHVNAFKGRLFFVEKNTLNAWYLDVGAIGGTASKLDFSSLCTLGGYLMAMGTWTRDGGDGVDDLAVFVTSKGEVLIYAGSDPSSVDSWALVGIFRIGKPIGRRCMLKLGAELVIISEDGFLPLSRILSNGRVRGGEIISNKIVKAVNDATRAYGSNFGWQAIFYPSRNMGIFNVPLKESGTTHQYVINTATGAWCRFTGINTSCWEIFNDRLYFGSLAGTNRLVMKFDDGLSDFGSNRNGDIKPAFSYFGARGRLKRFTSVRPVFTTDGDVSSALQINVDFEDKSSASVVASNSSSGSPWNTSPWNTSPWGISNRIVKDWQGASGIGYCGTVRMQVATRTREISVNSFDWLYEVGGYI